MSDDAKSLVASEIKLVAIMFLVFASFSSLAWMFLNAPDPPYPIIEVEHGVTYYFPYYVVMVFLLLLIPARLLIRMRPSRGAGISSTVFIALAISGAVLAIVDRYTRLLTLLNPIVDGLPSVPDLLR